MQKLVQQRTKMLETLPEIIGPVSVKVSDVHTGAWRYRRPVIRDEDCVRCGICATYCPCGVIEKTDDGMVIRGGRPLHGAAFQTYHDHRIAMSMAVCALVCQGESEIADDGVVAISYPDFFDALRRLGG